MDLEDIMEQVGGAELSKEEKVKSLRKSRAQLLEGIHKEQQLLDQVDYLLYKLEKQGGF